LHIGRDLHQFFTTPIRAQTEQDLDRAADHFARAIAVIGVDGLVAILLILPPAPVLACAIAICSSRV
jgi:hypothetical protein